MKASFLNKKIAEVYVDPLPYDVRPLPPLYIHNPVSVVTYLYALFVAPPVQQTKITGFLDLNDKTAAVKVNEQSMMLRLWQMGFFGKGSLSRSEPSWFGRTARRLGLDGGDLTLEEVSEERRKKRRQFKKERAANERRELNEKRMAEGLDPLPDLGKSKDEEDDEVNAFIREEDKALVFENTIPQLEYLQLTASEAVFLACGLGVLEVKDNKSGAQIDNLDLIKHLFANNSKRLAEYIVYHYFRSNQWCVRSGVKFGTDFLVYRRGPPFNHAEFAVMVMHANVDEDRDWWWHQGVSRVVGGVKKTMVFAYVEGPDPSSLDISNLNSVNEFKAMLKNFSVKTLVYGRWAPTRTRD